MKTIALLLLLAAQDASQLVEQLGDEDIRARERAAARLLELGPAVRPVLEKAAKSSDLEIRARVRTILGEIEVAEQRARSLGPVGRVTLPRGDYALQTLIERIKEQTGAAVKVPGDRVEARVTVEARDVPLLEFMDRLCLADGGLALAPRQARDAIELSAGAPWKGPTWYTGQFRVSIDRLRLEQRDPYDSRFERGSLLLAIAWQPNVRPIAERFSSGSPKFTVQELVGDNGKSLEVNPDLEAPYSGMSLGSRGERSVRRFVTFRHPAKGVRRLSALRGHVDVLLPLKIEDVVFDLPPAPTPQVRMPGAYKITLQSCESTGEGISAHLHIEAPAEDPGVEKPQQRVEIRSRFDPHSIEIVGDGGKLLHPKTVSGSHASSSGAEGLHTESHDDRLVFPADAGAKELRVRFIADYFDRRVEFEFKDVELP